MDEDEARRLADKHLRDEAQPRATNEEWREARRFPDVVALAEGSTPEEDVAADVAKLIRFWRMKNGGDPSASRRSVTRRSDPLSPPVWWEAESQQRLEAFAVDRFRAQRAAGVFKLGSREGSMSRSNADAPAWLFPHTGLADVSEVGPLVLGLAEEQSVRLGPAVDEYISGGWWQYEELVEFPTATWEDDRRVEYTSFIPEGRYQTPSIEHLHRETRWLAESLDISQAEALVWALVDKPFVLPWVPVKVSRRPWAPQPWETVTIQVNSTNATAQEVARAYTLAREQRPTRPWPALVVAFVERDAPKETWDERFRAFSSTYPDQKYRSLRTFRQAYYTQKNKEAKR
jgi:hypothetical protein